MTLGLRNMVESPEKALMQMKEHPSPHSDVQLQGESAGSILTSHNASGYDSNCTRALKSLTWHTLTCSF